MSSRHCSNARFLADAVAAAARVGLDDGVIGVAGVAIVDALLDFVALDVRGVPGISIVVDNSSAITTLFLGVLSANGLFYYTRIARSDL